MMVNFMLFIFYCKKKVLKIKPEKNFPLIITNLEARWQYAGA